MTRLDAALSYAARGWHVFPVHSVRDGACSCGDAECDSPGKHPRTDHGCLDATTDEDRIRAWWAEWPDANVGIGTGEASGIVVLDIDAKSGGPVSLERLVVERGPLPTTREVETGGGGQHLYFRHPGEPVKTRAGVANGVDIRGDGGYVVAPPSNHISTRNYRWKT